MIYGSVCSGIEAATAAWHPLGWIPAFFSEIDAFPRAVLKHRYPGVELHGDFTTIEADQYGRIDLLVGGTPCQSFSVAGLRGGLADDRGNLALEYIRLADRKRPRWVVWENVPGVFSSCPDDGTPGADFACFLSGLARWEVGVPADGWQSAGIIAPAPVDGAYGLAWRVLDAQYAGLAQRRRRVFVVGHLGDWRRAAAVLFERHSLQGHPAPRRSTGEGAAAPATRGADGGGGYAPDLDKAVRTPTGGIDREDMHTLISSGLGEAGELARALSGSGGATNGRYDISVDTFVAQVAPALDASYGRLQGASGQDANHGHSHLVAMSFKPAHYTRDKDGAPAHVAPALSADADRGEDTVLMVWPPDVADPITAVEGKTYTHEGSTFRMHNVVPHQVDVFAITADALRRGEGVAQEGVNTPGLGISTEGTASTLDASGPSAVAVVHTLAIRGRGDSHDLEWRDDGTANAILTPNGGRAGIGVGAIAFDTTQVTSPGNYSNPMPGDPSHPLTAGGDPPAVAFTASGRSNTPAWETAIRRLTPRECERLQGFGDDFTAIPWRGKPADQCPDGPRYKALGNSMAIPVMAWVGRRIQMVEDLTNGADARGNAESETRVDGETPGR